MQVSEQLAPEARVPGQLPMPPFAGGVTEHEFAEFAAIGMPSRATANQPIIVDFIPFKRP